MQRAHGFENQRLEADLASLIISLNDAIGGFGYSMFASLVSVELEVPIPKGRPLQPEDTSISLSYPI